MSETTEDCVSRVRALRADARRVRRPTTEDASAESETSHEPPQPSPPDEITDGVPVDQASMELVSTDQASMEQAVLTAILKEPDVEARRRMLKEIPDDLIAERTNRSLLRAIRALDRADATLAPDSIVAASGGDVALDFVRDLLDNYEALPEPNVRVHVSALRRFAVVHAASRRAENLFQALDERDLDRAEASALEIARTIRIARGDNLIEADHIKARLERAAEVFQRRYEKLDPPITTPWKGLNGILGGGFRPGLTILVSHPGAGKTALALEIALHAARAQIPTMYVALEGAADAYDARVLSTIGGKFPWSAYYHGKADFASDYEDHREVLSKLPLHLHHPNAYELTYQALATRVEVFRLMYPSRPALIVLDYLQLLAGEDPREPLRERVGRAAYELTRITRDGATVIAISSSARHHYDELTGAKKTGFDVKRLQPIKLLGTGKEAGEIEFACENVLVMLKPVNADRLKNGSLPHYVVAAKLRACPHLGWSQFSYDGRSFSEIGHGLYDGSEWNRSNETNSKPTSSNEDGPNDHRPRIPGV